MDKNKRRRSIIAILIVVIIVTTSFSIFFAYQKFKPTPAYEFKTGVNHPQEISDLIRNGTVVLYFTLDHCPPCRDMTPKMEDLRSQYNSSGVTIIMCNYTDKTQPQFDITQNFGRNYGITTAPAILVIRGDGAIATFIGEVDISTVKSAIEEAQHGKSIFPF
jgi:thiol-disulfide isomerase/thioredoxin